MCDFPATSPKAQPNLPQTEATHTLLGQAWSLLLVGALGEMSQPPECCKLGYMTLHLQMSEFGPPRSRLGSTRGRSQQVGMREWGESKTGSGKEQGPVDALGARSHWRPSERCEGVSPLEAGALGSYPRLSSFTGSLQPPGGEDEAQVLGGDAVSKLGGMSAAAGKLRRPRGFGQGSTSTSPSIHGSYIRDAGSLQIFSHSKK